MNWELTFADGAGTTTKMVPTDNGGHIPALYGDLMGVFSKDKAETLPPYRSTDHAIDLEPGYNLTYGRIYHLSEFELRTLKAYIEAHLVNGFIQRSSSPAAAPILFAKKTDGGLRQCVDYRAVNKATVMNPYPLPLVSEMLLCVREARIFTKLDLCGAYNLIWIKEGDECRTAFRTRYGRFKYQVMPFVLTNPPANILSSIDDCQPPYTGNPAVCYLDDILIYLTNEKEHKEHVRQVLQLLKVFGHYCKAEKCQFGVSEVAFQGFVITPNGVGMESDQISTMEDLPTPKSVRDIQVLPRFTNFYRRFIQKYAKVTLPLTELLNESETSPGKKPEGSAKSEWTWEAELAFGKLKRTFTEAPILQHFDPAKRIILQTDASGFAIAGILNQYDVFGVLRPVNFYSGKCAPAEQNHDTYDRELLAIVETLQQWRHYLEGANYIVLIRCDLKNLEFFQTSKVLSWRQARWSEILSAYDLVNEHLEGSKNPADGPPRRPDYEIGYERPVARLLATAPVEPYDDLVPAIIATQVSDSLVVDVSAKLVDRPAADGTDTTEKETQWDVVTEALTYGGGYMFLLSIPHAEKW